jgi:protein-S-isoprenylcysteine O-methyltransferase Ste14
MVVVLLSMKATDWEFTNRALVFGLIFAISFPLYSLDHQNSAGAFGNWLGPRIGADPDHTARFLFAFAALLLVTAALLRTWTSAYLEAGVVYASTVKTEDLVADGPYRHTRNPLYLANILMAIGMGALMSRIGFVVAVLLMVVFSYRLTLREETELRCNQGERYERYANAVPRLWPSLLPRTVSAGRQPNWRDGFKAESWYWGFAASSIAFAITLNLKVFFAIFGASIVVFWASSAILRKKSKGDAQGSMPR